MAARMAGTRTIRHRPRRLLRAGAGLVLLLAIVATGAVALWLFVLQAGPRAEDDARRFLAAWSRGDDRGAAALTDQPKVAAESLAANRRGLDGASLRARLLDVREDGDGARARAELAWDVPGIGRFAYPVSMTLRRGDDRWTVAWSERVVHPKLEDDTQRLGTTREAALRGDILDRDGVAIVRPRTVYRVGLARDEVTDVGASVDALARVVDIDRRSLTPGRPRSRPAAVRRGDRATRGRLRAGQGRAEGRAGRSPSTTRLRSRRAEGSRGRCSARSGPRRPSSSSSSAGRALRRRGRPVRPPGPVRGAARRRGDARGGDPRRRRAGRDAAQPKATRAAAAHDALDRRAARRRGGARRSPGRGLAGGRPAVDRRHPGRRQPARGHRLDRALEGRYPPGSTFKVVTTAALLRAGLQPDEIVDCPRTIDVGGRSFKNFEGNAQGRGSVRAGLRAVVQHGVRLAHRAPAGRGTGRGGARLRARRAAAVRDAGRGAPGPPGRDLVAAPRR